MTHRRAIVSRIASNTVTFLLLFNLFGVVAHLLIDYTGLGYLLMAAPFFLLCWLWRRIKNPRVFLAWLVAVAVATVLVANFAWDGGATVIVFMVLICVRFVVIVMTEQEKDYEISTAVGLFVVHVVLYVAVYFLGSENNALLNQLSVTYLFMVLLILLCVHMSNIEMRMVVLQSGKATRAVLSANNRIIAGFAAVVLVVGGLVALLRPGRLVVWVVGGIGRLPGLFARTRTEGEVAVLPAPEEELLHSTEMEYDLHEYLELIEFDYEGATRFFSIALYVQLIVTGILVAICLAFLSRRITLRRRARRVTTSGDDAAQALETSFLDDLLGLLPRRLQFRHPVRRAYARKVNRHIRAGVRVSGSDTTDVIREKINPQEDISNLTAQYEKVRYGRGD